MVVGACPCLAVTAVPGLDVEVESSEVGVRRPRWRRATMMGPASANLHNFGTRSRIKTQLSSARHSAARFPMMPVSIREYRETDAPALNGVALAAFTQFKDQYSDWPSMAASVSRMSDLASTGEITLAEINGQVVGGVAYVPGGKPKAAYFDQSWPIIRMLVVDPASRGMRLGRTLTEECIRRARRDQAPLIALHTTPIMAVALPMYLSSCFATRRLSMAYPTQFTR
jgi:ribosomal protein S18 acetylase RimI-like enzyme